MECELDTNQLPGDEAKTLRSLVKRSKLETIKKARPAKTPDAMTYELTVETSEGLYHVSFDDLNVPQAVEPLLSFLQRRAKPRPPR
ncbi:MAG: hypothetical protein NZ823_16530 [Blastocatellia bacterium]|nr:hypothetical protein [Blastocatellia bacterium]